MNSSSKHFGIFGLVVFLSVLQGWAASLSLPRIFSEHMVLQAHEPVPVWGWAEPGDSVTVEFFGQKKTAVASADGKWQVMLDPMPASAEPLVMNVHSTLDTRHLSISDVIVGEVWLASGQSNMGLNVGMCDDSEAGLKMADELEIRFFASPVRVALTPQDDLAGGSWVVCTSQNSEKLSAVAYYFGCKLSRTLNSPVGMIQAAWGGSRIQNWIPRDELKSNPELSRYVEEFDQQIADLTDEQKTPEGLMGLGDIYLKYNREWVKYQKTKQGTEPVAPKTPRPRHAVALNYNAMIHPLVPYKIQGALWYQGEANTRPVDHALYAEMLSSLIQGWRNLWSSDFPVIVAQLPEWEAKGREEYWISVRDQQRQVLDRKDNTAMVVTIGYGNMKDIHPLNKRPVGELMANAALSKTYHIDTPWCGPLVQSAVQNDSRLKLSFETFGRKLIGEGALDGFEVSSDGQTYQAVTAKIEDDNVVINVDGPVQSVRYGWDVNPELTLKDDAGLPASPFLKDVL